MWIKQFNNTHFISKTNNTNINNFNIFHKNSIENSENLNQNNEMIQMFAKLYTSIGFKEKRNSKYSFNFHILRCLYSILFPIHGLSNFLSYFLLENHWNKYIKWVRHSNNFEI